MPDHSQRRTGLVRRVGFAVTLFLATVLAVAPRAGATSFPGPNGKVVFIKGTRLSTMFANGTGLATLGPAGGSFDASPAWNWYSDKVVFTRGTGSTYATANIFKVNANGAGFTQLTTGSDYNDDPTWAPDGTRIAFMSNRAGGNKDIYTMKADGTDVKRLTTASGTDRSPSWSPLGDRIAFSGIQGASDPSIWTMNPYGTELQKISSGAGADESPSWAPDGTQIVFSSNRNSGHFEIWKVNVSTKVETRLTHETQNIPTDFGPSWSPDGTKIMFSRGHPGQNDFDLWTMNPDGTNQMQVSSFSGSEFQPSWGQDCTPYVYINNALSSTGLLDSIQQAPPISAAGVLSASPCASPPPIPPPPPPPPPPVHEQPIYFVHGIAGPGSSGNDCPSTWDRAKDYLQAQGWSGPMRYVHYYAGDTDCTTLLQDHNLDVINGDRNTPIETIAEGLAWTIYRNDTVNNVPVRILAHSMGGVIARYAIAKAGSGDPKFPPKKIMVPDVVTLGSPHAGSTNFAQFGCSTVNGNVYECAELTPGSSFLADIAANAQNPQGQGGTDWSIVGSVKDFYVSSGSAMSMSAAHKYIYHGSNCDGTTNVTIQVTPTIDFTFFGVHFHFDAVYLTFTVPRLPCDLALSTWITHTDPSTGYAYYHDLNGSYDSTVEVNGSTSYTWPHVVPLINLAFNSSSY